MTSLCTEYYQIFLAQAVLLGISMALIINPSLAVVSRRLARRRGLALGLVLGGSSIGGVVWPIMLERLLSHDQVSFGWTLRAVAFTMIPLLAIACLTVKEAPEIPPSPSEMISDGPEASQTETQDEKPVKKKTDLSILKIPAFDLLCAGLAIGYLGLFAPTFYISSFAISNGVSSQLAFYLLSVYNAGSFFGRVLPGHWADRFGHFNICTLSVFVSGITGFCWISAKSPAGLTVWTLAYGFASGVGIISHRDSLHMSTS
jgi:MFS family permease